MDENSAENWKLYKAHTELFDDDCEYYYNFCAGYKTLELFAGYGRLTNFLADRKIDIQSIEIERNFAQFIKLPPQKNHIANILEYEGKETFERIIAGYNSFCLFRKDEDIIKFFSKIGQWLKPGGYASLSYYHQDYWAEAVPMQLELNNKEYQYLPSFVKNGNDSLWIDEYICGENKIKMSYSIKIYSDDASLTKYLEHTELELVDKVYNFNKKELFEPGWIDFIFRKKINA